MVAKTLALAAAKEPEVEENQTGYIHNAQNTGVPVNNVTFLPAAAA
jgi:hypothetical protein